MKRMSSLIATDSTALQGVLTRTAALYNKLAMSTFSVQLPLLKPHSARSSLNFFTGRAAVGKESSACDGVKCLGQIWVFRGWKSIQKWNGKANKKSQ